MFKELLDKKGFWSQRGPYSDVVLSTRVRLGRNVQGVPFPHKQDEKDADKIKSIAETFIQNSQYNNCTALYDLKEIDSNDKRFLRERNILTYEMEVSNNGFVILDNNENFSILVNEEDHFRVQIIKSGFQLMETYQFADLIDDELNKFVPYAFSDDFGYITACPSNLGTGLRISTMLHLPALSISGGIPEVIRKTSELGAKISGSLGDGTKTFGNMYLLSNRISLGLSEVDIIEEIDKITSKVVEMESLARDNFISQEDDKLKDMIWRYYGILKYSRSISYTEAMDYLSNIRLGIILFIIKDIELQEVNNMMINIQWSHLQKIANRIFSNSYECDSFRSEYIRMNLA